MAKHPPRRQKHPSKTDQRGKWQPNICQRSDDDGKSSAKTTVVAKHPPAKHKTTAA